MNHRKIRASERLPRRHVAWPRHQRRTRVRMGRSVTPRLIYLQQCEMRRRAVPVPGAELARRERLGKYRQVMRLRHFSSKRSDRRPARCALPPGVALQFRSFFMCCYGLAMLLCVARCAVACLPAHSTAASPRPQDGRAPQPRPARTRVPEANQFACMTIACCIGFAVDAEASAACCRDPCQWRRG